MLAIQCNQLPHTCIPTLKLHNSKSFAFVFAPNKFDFKNASRNVMFTCLFFSTKNLVCVCVCSNKLAANLWLYSKHASIQPNTHTYSHTAEWHLICHELHTDSYAYWLTRPILRCLLASLWFYFYFISLFLWLHTLTHKWHVYFRHRHFALHSCSFSFLQLNIKKSLGGAHFMRCKMVWRLDVISGYDDTHKSRSI